MLTYIVITNNLMLLEDSIHTLLYFPNRNQASLKLTLKLYNSNKKYN